MLRQHIVSSNIATVGYHRGSLFIEFHNGGCYQYDKVTLQDYLKLANSESVGHHFHVHIRGKFNYTKLDYNPFATPVRKAA